MKTTHETDVVIVGAGLSGLIAARACVAAGLDVVVLEARDRVGGRLKGIELNGNMADVGGQYVGPTQTAVRALVDELGLTLAATPDEGEGVTETTLGRILSGQKEDGGVADATAELYRRIDALAVRVGADAPWRAADAADLDLLSVAEWVEQESLPEPASELVTVLTRTLFGAEPGNTSMLFLANYVAQGDDAATLTGTDGAAQATWIVEGAYRLPVLLADALGERVRLRSPVIAIMQNAERCMVGTETALYTANRVIVALPPPLADTIAFDPPLPLLRARLQHGARMGDYQKVILRYDRPFWRDVGLSALSASSLGPITNTLEKSASADDGMLVGFVGGCWAKRLSAMSADERHATLTEQLVRLFGEVARCPVSIHVEDWSADPWTGGGPVQVMPPGLLSAMGDVLRTPSGRVHWAGTEAASKWTGYMDGAVRAGDAAALQVISLLRDHLGTA